MTGDGFPGWRHQLTGATRDPIQYISSACWARVCQVCPHPERCGCECHTAVAESAPTPRLCGAVLGPVRALEPRVPGVRHPCGTAASPLKEAL